MIFLFATPIFRFFHFFTKPRLFLLTKQRRHGKMLSASGVLPRIFAYGEMSERFKEPVLKTGDTAMCRGFESHSLRQLFPKRFYSVWSGTQEAEGAPLLRE